MPASEISSLAILSFAQALSAFSLHAKLLVWQCYIWRGELFDLACEIQNLKYNLVTVSGLYGFMWFHMIFIWIVI